MASTSSIATTDLRSIEHTHGWLAEELALVWLVLREPYLWLVLLATLTTTILAYRAPFRQTIDVGGSPQQCTTTPLFDQPYLAGFNIDPEYDQPPIPPDCADRSDAFRWAGPDAAVTVPGLGRAPVAADIALTVGQPSGQIAPTTLSNNGSPLLRYDLAPGPRTYHLLIPAADSVDLHWQSPRYQPPGDPRELAFALDRLSIAVLSAATPAITALWQLTALAGLLYLSLRRWTLEPRTALVVGIGAVAVVALLITRYRTGLGLGLSATLTVVAAGYLVAIGAVPLFGGLARLAGMVTTQRELRILAALIAIAWIVRAVGMLHPQTWDSDIGLNSNNLALQVARGDLLFVEGLPSEAGGGEAPYPPAQYIVLLPWLLLVDDPRLIVTVGAALADALVIGSLWLLVRAAGLKAAVALFGGAIYVVALPLLRSLSIGELANVWGQALAAPWLATVVLWLRGEAPKTENREPRTENQETGVRSYGPRTTYHARSLLLAIVTAIALLAHSGVFLLIAIACAWIGVLLLFRNWRVALRWAAITGAAGIVAAVLYFSAFIGVLEAGTPPALTTTALQRIGREAHTWIALRGVLGPLLLIIGGSGTLLLMRRSTTLRIVMAAIWLTVFSSWLTLLNTAQALRWEAWIVGPLAVGAGGLLAVWWQRDRWRWLAVTLVTAIIIHGLIWWIYQLVTYR